MESSPVLSHSSTHHGYLGHSSSGRQMSLSTSFNDLSYEQEEFKPFTTPSPTSQSSSQSTAFPSSYVNASTSSPYSPHGIASHSSHWQSHLADPRMTRPRSTYPPVDPLTVPSNPRHHSRADPWVDSGSYNMRKAPSSSPPYPSLLSSGHYATGHYNSNYSYAPTLSSHHSMSGPASNESRCEWGGGRCDVPLEDTTPAGIARHLRQYHDIAVTDNRNRGMCAWGGRCNKDMFPSSFGKHIAECHLRNMTKQCPYCRADFARADTLSRHIKAFCPHTTGGGGGGGAQAHPHPSG